jgi:hypothetical protein
MPLIDSISAKYETARSAYEENGLDSLSLDQLQDLIVGECWADGAEPEIAATCGTPWDSLECARNYLVQAFKYRG